MLKYLSKLQRYYINDIIYFYFIAGYFMVLSVNESLFLFALITGFSLAIYDGIRKIINMYNKKLTYVFVIVCYYLFLLIANNFFTSELIELKYLLFIVIIELYSPIDYIKDELEYQLKIYSKL